jgi:hypothetical protein
MGQGLQLSTIFSIFLQISASVSDLHLLQRITAGRPGKLVVHVISETAGVLEAREESAVGLGDWLRWQGEVCRELMWMLTVRRRGHGRIIRGGRC